MAEFKPIEVEVVINTQAGGFNISNEAIEAYLTRRKVEWTRDPELTFGSEYLFKFLVNGCIMAFGGFNSSAICRNDPDLIAVVRELGEKANGAASTLKIVKVKLDLHIEDDGSGRESITGSGVDYTGEMTHR